MQTAPPREEVRQELARVSLVRLDVLRSVDVAEEEEAFTLRVLSFKGLTYRSIHARVFKLVAAAGSGRRPLEVDLPALV